MKSKWIKLLLPHAIAVLVFLVVALIYCRPALEGKVVNQHDITHWKGSIQQSVEYAKTHDGVYPLWTNSLFSGMPAFQIGYTSNNKIPWTAHTIFTFGLPKPIQFFFLASLCFYFLCVVLGVRTVFGILGSLAFAYATYNPVIISVGHDTKMLSIAYMPALLASLLLIYEKKYWPGAGLTALFTSVLISMNHPQIAYYLFLAVAIMTIFYTVRWIKNKEWRHFALTAGFTIAAAITGVLTNAVALLSTYEYQKETIRGGGSQLRDTTAKNENAKTGLTKDYALSYSMNIAEPFVMMVPRMFGGSSSYEEVDQEKSKAIEALRTLPQELQQQLPLSYYWGGMTKYGEVGTSGPPYVGAIICMLALIGFFVLDNKHKWWMLVTVALTIVMSWGHYFESFNGLLYKYLPMYNKFRAPSMILVIPQMLLPLLAVLGINKIATAQDKKSLSPLFKKGMIATAAVFALLFVLYIMSDFLSGTDKEILKQVREANNPQLLQAVNSFFEGLKEDRKGLMMGDILRSFGFIAAAAIMLFLALRNTMKPLALGIGLCLFALIDVMTIDVKYLNSDSYVDKTENEAAFVKTQKDDEILRDTSFYRVMNLSGGAFSENITSYYHNSVGGYHPAKIAIYQDLIERKITPELQAAAQALQTGAAGLASANIPVMNMLNAKYFIQKDRNYQTVNYWKNDGALGNCWLVKGIRYVKDAHEEMEALGGFNPRDTAIVLEAFKSSIPSLPAFDSAADISLVKNDNDVVIYRFNAAAGQFAVFSEVYYKSGWKAYIDGKEAPIVKVNYVLRGLAIPAGRHEIKFEFKPQGYYTGKKLTSIFSIVLLVMLAAGILLEWRSRKQAAMANLSR